MNEPTSIWRKLEVAMDSKTAYYINAVIMVVTIAGLIAYVVMT
jgi:hypothetical protein